MSNKPRILYVDDEELNLMLFKANFSGKFEIITCSSAENGFKEIAQSEKFDFDAIISDLSMPHVNGLQFIKRVKKEHPTVPCFLLTGYDINDEIQTALDDNIIQKYFSKPFDLYRIVIELEKATLQQ